MFSASSEARDRNAPTNANQIRLQTSRIRQEHRPIRYQLPARLSFRQGHPSSRSVAVHGSEREFVAAYVSERRFPAAAQKSCRVIVTVTFLIVQANILA